MLVNFHLLSKEENVHNITFEICYHGITFYIFREIGNISPDYHRINKIRMVMMKIHISGLRLSGEKGEVFFFKKTSFVVVVDKLFMYVFSVFTKKKCKDKYNKKANFKKVSYRKKFVKLFFIVVLLYLPLDLVLESDSDLRRCPPEFSAEAPSNP